MEVRQHPLPPDLQHVLDGGVEYGHITGGAHVACFLFADIDELDRVHSMPHPDKRGWDATAAMCAEVEAYGQRLIAQIDEPNLRAACLGSTTTSFLHALSEYAEFVCGQSYEDAIWGGSMIHRHETAANWRGRIHRRLARRLRTDGWVKRACRNHHGESGYEHLRHLRALIGTPLPPVNEYGFKLLSIALNDQRARSVERSRKWLADHAPAIRRETRRAQTRERRSIIRAAALASAIVGASAVSAFARGEPVRLPGDDIVLEVRLAQTIRRCGHGAVNIMLKDRDDAYLAGLCVYQDELPAFDQLASLALHVQSGCIGDVIKAGNVFNPSPNAFAHPALNGKVKPTEVIGASVHDRLVFPIDNFDVRQGMMRNYEAEMGDRFRHRIFIDLLGAREGAQAWSTFIGFRGRQI